MKKRYILDKDYFDSNAARLYKEGESIVLDDKDPAVKHCSTVAEAKRKAEALKAGEEDIEEVEDADEVPNRPAAPKAKAKGKGASALL